MQTNHYHLPTPKINNFCMRILADSWHLKAFTLPFWRRLQRPTRSVISVAISVSLCSYSTTAIKYMSSKGNPFYPSRSSFSFIYTFLLDLILERACVLRECFFLFVFLWKIFHFLWPRQCAVQLWVHLQNAILSKDEHRERINQLPLSAPSSLE